MQEPILTASELSIINYLKSLPLGERATYKQISLFTGISERGCKEIVERLRRNGYRIISSKKKSDLGTRFAVDEKEWHQYLAQRQKEMQTTMNSILRM